MEYSNHEPIRMIHTKDQDLLNSIKSIKTSIELVRDEFEELHQLIIELLKKTG